MKYKGFLFCSLDVYEMHCHEKKYQSFHVYLAYVSLFVVSSRLQWKVRSGWYFLEILKCELNPIN